MKTKGFEETLIDLVDQHFPKNETAAQGGAPSPGRGQAMVLVSQALIAHQKDKQEAIVAERGKIALLINRVKLSVWHNKLSGVPIDPDAMLEVLRECFLDIRDGRIQQYQPKEEEK